MPSKSGGGKGRGEVGIVYRLSHAAAPRECRSLPKIVPVRARDFDAASRVPSTSTRHGMPRSRGNSGNADPGWRTVFVTFISRQVRANIAHFLPEFGCNARIIRIKLERRRRRRKRGAGSERKREEEERGGLVLFRV